MSITDDTSYNTTLYIGDLHFDATELSLIRVFGENVISSCKVVRDNDSKRPLGYAYLNFYSHEEADKAMKNYNQKSCMGKPMRIMWAERNPDRRRDNKANLFIKNIDTSVDAKTIYDAFSTFGTILSFKIATDDNGHSLGYGFIHYSSVKDAEDVIKRVNGVNFNGKEISVQHLVPRKDRPGSSVTVFNNLFFKNIEGIEEEELRKEFEKFGKISSFYIPVDEQEIKKLFGFVCFANSDSAMKAAEEMNNKKIGKGEKLLYVTKALKKHERQAQLQKERDERRRQLYSIFKDKNLYVKNFPENVTENDLKDLFSEFGNITSCRVMMDSQNKSRMFGFVCFDTIESAQKAREAINGKLMDNKSLYVAVAQSREERRYQFSLQYNNMRMNNQANMRNENALPGFPAQPRNVPMVGPMNGVPMHPGAGDRRNGGPPQIALGNFQSVSMGQMSRGPGGLISQYGQAQAYGIPQPPLPKTKTGVPYFKQSMKENAGGRRPKGHQDVVVEDTMDFNSESLVNVMKGISANIMPSNAVASFVELVIKRGEYKKYASDSAALQGYLSEVYKTFQAN